MKFEVRTNKQAKKFRQGYVYEDPYKSLWLKTDECSFVRLKVGAEGGSVGYLFRPHTWRRVRDFTEIGPFEPCDE